MVVQAEDNFGTRCIFFVCGICGRRQYVFSDFQLSGKEDKCPFFCKHSLKQTGCRQGTFDLILQCRLSGDLSLAILNT